MTELEKRILEIETGKAVLAEHELIENECEEECETR